MTEFVIRRTVRARPETVFDVFTDHCNYPRLVRLIRDVELEREGEPAPNGAGAIRVLHVVGATMREQVTAFERPDHFSYRLLSGAPLREYVSSVSFAPTGRGTDVVYSVSATPTVPLVGVAIGWLVKAAIRRLVVRAGAEAERRG